MGIFARRQRHGDVCGLGLCGYCGAFDSLRKRDKVTERWWRPSKISCPIHSRLMDCSQGYSYADRETSGHVLAPKILARRVVKILDYWALILHDLVMTKTSEFLTKSSESLIL